MISTDSRCKTNTISRKTMSFAICLRWFCVSSLYDFQWSMSCFCFSESFSFILTIYLKLFSLLNCEENENAKRCRKHYWHSNWKMMSFSSFVRFISCEFFSLWIIRLCLLNVVCVRSFECSKTFSTLLRRIIDAFVN